MFLLFKHLLKCNASPSLYEIIHFQLDTHNHLVSVCHTWFSLSVHCSGGFSCTSLVSLLYHLTGFVEKSCTPLHQNANMRDTFTLLI